MEENHVAMSPIPHVSHPPIYAQNFCNALILKVLLFDEIIQLDLDSFEQVSNDSNILFQSRRRKAQGWALTSYVGSDNGAEKNGIEQ